MERENEHTGISQNAFSRAIEQSDSVYSTLDTKVYSAMYFIGISCFRESGFDERRRESLKRKRKQQDYYVFIFVLG